MTTITIPGTAGNDYLPGTALDERFNTGNGADTVEAGDGNDEVNGSVTASGARSWLVVSGNKVVSAGRGNDTVFGGSGADRLLGEEGDDSLFGLAGSDLIDGGVGRDSLDGGDGADTLIGGAGADTLEGSNGDDYLSGDGDADVLYHQGTGAATLLGGEGNDVLDTFGSSSAKRLDGGAGADTLNGGDQGDRLIGGDGADYLHGWAGMDTLDGGAGDDTLFGGLGNDLLDGGSGDDEIYEQTAGADTLQGGDGNDLLSVFTGSGDKVLDGGGGRDTLQGADSAESLSGGDGDDLIYGRDGADTLSGGAGIDILYGGAGNDLYLITDRLDRISDDGGTDTARISADFVKIPLSIENRIYLGDAQALPYWIDALTSSDANWHSQLVGSNRTLFYTFPSTLPSYNTSAKDATGYSAFTEAQQARTRAALDYVSSVVNLQFVATGTADAPNTLAFAMNRQTGSAGYARFPSDTALGSDVFLNDSPDNRALADGTYASLTLIHEIGHAIGLKHPFTEPNDGDNEGPFLGAREDRTEWTVMSYQDSAAQYRFAFSPLDLAALHYLYGPSPTARAGADTHRVSATAPNFIWDGAGSDTLDASGLSQGATLYLTPGWWGFVGSTRGTLITDPGQVTVNFGTVIENLVGSGFSDRLTGNEADNRISGGAGADTLIGGAGADTLEGGDGLDAAVYAGRREGYSILADATNGTIAVSGTGSDRDVLSGVERLHFADISVALDANGVGGQVYMLYKAAFNRVPDPGGVGFWMHFIENGFDKLTAVTNFMNSAEFHVMYDNDASTPGYQDPTPEKFVALLYQNVLGRAGEQEGFQFWVDAMNNQDGRFGKKFSHAEVLKAFAESSEYLKLIIGTIANGFDYTPFSG